MVDADETLGTLKDPWRSGRREEGRERDADDLVLLLQCERPAAEPERWELDEVASALIQRARHRGVEKGAGPDGPQLQVEIADAWASRPHAQLHRAGGRWLVRDLQSKNGTWIEDERIDERELGDRELIECGHTFFLFRRERIGEDPLAGPDPLPVRTYSRRFAAALRRLVAVAPSSTAVLLRGETGTGKEVLANAVHTLSRRPGLFQPVNCAAISRELAESELFGHRKGAFTGASEDKPGLVAMSDRGTLFLDEIGDLPPALQPKLLRALQEREFTPVGATRPVKVDLRVVAATHRDLETMCEKGDFRADLLARLEGLVVRIPPLRDRREDLGLLVQSLIPRIETAAPRPVSFTPDAVREMIEYSWPRNVRELEQHLNTAIQLAAGSPIDVHHLFETSDEAPPEAGRPASPLSPEQAARKDELRRLLAEHHGNVKAVAEVMNKQRTQIHRWMKQYGIDAREFRR